MGPDPFADLDNKPDTAPVPTGIGPDPYASLDTPKDNGFFRKVDDVVRAAGNAVTLGGADKIASGLSYMGLLPTEYGGGDQAKQAKWTGEARTRTPWGSIAGDLAGGGAAALATGGAIGGVFPALARPTIASITANAAATGATMSAGEDLVQGERPGLAKAAINAGIGGTLAPIATGLSRVFSPMERLRAAGAALTPADKTAMTALNATTDPRVPLSIPELAGAAARPGSDSGVTALMNTSLASPHGSIAGYRFQQERAAAFGDATRGVANDLNATAQAAGYSTQQDAVQALKEVRKSIGDAADPLYRQSERTRVGGVVLPDQNIGPATMSAHDNVMNDPLIARDLEGYQPNSIKALDYVQKQLGADYQTAATAGSPRAPLILDEKQRLLSAMDARAPAYGQARDMFSRGMELQYKPLEAGPLGALAQSAQPRTQAKTFFDASSPGEASDAAFGLSHIPQAAQQGLLAQRVGDAANIARHDPRGFPSAVFPSPEALPVGEQAAAAVPQTWAELHGLMNSANAMNPRLATVAPFGHESGAVTLGPIEDAWVKARQIGRGQTAQALLDPENIPALGVRSGLSQGSVAGLLGTSVDVVHHNMPKFEDEQFLKYFGHAR